MSLLSARLSSAKCLTSNHLPESKIDRRVKSDWVGFNQQPTRDESPMKIGKRLDRTIQLTTIFPEKEKRIVDIMSDWSKREDLDLVISCQQRATGASIHSVNGWLGTYRGSLVAADGNKGEKQKMFQSWADEAEKNLRIFLRTGEIPRK